MIIQSATEFSCGVWKKREVLCQAVEQDLSSDTGLLLFAQFDKKLGWTKEFASLISDQRVNPDHSALSIVRQRVFGILAGYEDQNDHDTLRSDPIFKLISGRELSDADLASQPTISRLENAVTAGDLLKMEKWCIEQFVNSFDEPPERITLDIDTYDDPTHGRQQLTFWHNYYRQNQYQVRVLTCAENDMVVLPSLLFGSAAAKLGAAEELRTVIERIRERFPEVRIHVRADSGFGGNDVYDTLESFVGVTYSIGMSINTKTKKLCESLYQETIAAQESSGQDELRYMSITDYKSKYWSRARQLVIKCEATAHSTSRRVVISNRPEVADNPESVYRGYAGRGESENRNKELKCGLMADRLSDHRYMANLFRLMMHCVSHNMLVLLRRLVALEQPQLEAGESEPTESELVNRPFVETRQERKVHNDRRRRDPLGEGHPCTWRTHVIKVASRIVVSTRRVILQLSASWPHLRYFRHVADAIDRYRPLVT
jgi:hypothetical protein